MILAILAALVTVCSPPSQDPAKTDPIAALVTQLEAAAAAGNREQILSLIHISSPRDS